MVSNKWITIWNLGLVGTPSIGARPESRKALEFKTQFSKRIASFFMVLKQW